MGRKKQYTDRELIQGRVWTCDLYPDSNTYDYTILLERLKWCWSDQVEWFYAFHDCDSYTDDDLFKYKKTNNTLPTWTIGELKKPHYHIVVNNNSPIVLGNAAQKFGIPSNYVEKVEDYKKAVRYLIHLDHAEKYQYKADIIVTNAEKKLLKFLNDDMSATEKAKKLLDYIYSSAPRSIGDLAEYAISCNCWDELRRGQHIYTSIMIERLKNND